MDLSFLKGQDCEAKVLGKLYLYMLKCQQIWTEARWRDNKILSIWSRRQWCSNERCSWQYYK